MKRTSQILLKDTFKKLKKVDEKEETTTGNRTCNVAGEI